ncbi:MAG: FkbM family methyltransferase, partial [Alkalinema sp. RU_4_3]|nr:FkbM family methyltransferase [Alkalinema sp. RU_4_3]
MQTLTDLRRAIAADPAAFAPQYEYHNETRNDRWIVEYMFPGKRSGYFIEAGATNGISGSSCYVLETELDWRGLCIEPNPEFFANLV